ncbi:hypothetical protein [Natrarchaeobaculum sulfurireducens]|uniref:Uncharacterized protein n=1 Tax=Natrarchaeobaculum sulfurireducens TaxID=2044521 RepID=A0A346PE10_9EURY|nr:hypothetical protein [Natrarchaeobaculum sulfurireducens]AXR77755.1 hypothetical protein AArc1_1421 [Natrarchaeobaculum sulfurireducens]
MFDTSQALRIGRNLLVYTVGVALLVVAALGLADAIDLETIIAAPLFVVGLVLVLVVHEHFGGPV